MRSVVGLLLLASLVCLGAWAMQSQSSPPPQKPAETKPAEQKPAPDVTGPERPVGETIAPRRPPSKSAKRRAPADIPKPGEQPYSIAVNVDLVTVDVTVQDKNGNFIPSLGKKNFRIVEDGVPQQLQTYETTEAPMTVVLVVEFNNLYQQVWTETWHQTLSAAYGFLDTLRPEDWVAIVAYDMRPEILQDFTQNKQAAQAAMQRLRFPAFSEANLFDTLDEVLSRLSDVAGKKGVVAVTTGIDTFSKITYDTILKKVQASEVPIYPIGMMQMLRELADARGYLGPIARMDFLQADNALRTFAQYSGGRAFFPRFYGEFPGIFGTISGHMRNQYTLGYSSSNSARDGKFRKIKVELVDETGKPLKIVNQKGKDVKYTVYAKSGYIAPKGEATVQ